MALTWYRLFQWKKWVELFFSVPNLLLPLFYKVSVVTMKSSIPDIFKISAVWGAHEGSLLLWALVLSVWSVAVSIFSKRLPSEVLNHIPLADG
jgi:cytochrome c-type biogenesis protein CcmF